MVPNHSPRRVVCLQPSATAILAAIGCAERIVACTKYCADICPEVTHHTGAIVADSWTAQSAQIQRAQPDLVIASVPYQEKAVVEILKSGARFLGFAPKTLADIYVDIAVIAGIMDATVRGEEVIAGMQATIAEVRRKTGNLARPRVFCEEWGKPIITSQPWVAELVEAAGGEFLGVPAQPISAQAVLEAAPDVVLAAWCGAGDRVPLEKITRERGWNALPAVRKGRVYCIRDEFLNTPAPTLLQGLRALAAAIHPEYFPQAPGLTRIRNIITPA